MGRPATEHEWQNTHSRMRHWLLKNHPDVYREYSAYIQKNAKNFKRFLEVDLDKLPNLGNQPLGNADKSNVGAFEYPEDEPVIKTRTDRRSKGRVYVIEKADYDPADPHQGSHPN